MRITITILSLVLVGVGCASRPASSASSHGLEPITPAETAAFREQLSAPMEMVELDARVVPPIDWTREPFKQSDRHNHLVWVSPTGGAAYGVIHFTLPLPVGEELALRGFLAEMKKSEGEATLLSKNRDGDQIRFVAEGGKYRIRGILRTRGFRGWAVYAGTLRSASPAVDELALAVQARENTALGLARD
jgi:hypothetical protein